MTLCTVACRHACNVVMIEAILCAASLSLCYTATCYDISGCIGSCWYMGDSKCKDSALHIQAEQTQIQWKQPLLVCCFHDVYNIVARRICINRFWLAGGKAIILIGFPPFYTCIVGVNPQPWVPSNTQTKECIASIRSAELHQYHQIHCSSPGQKSFRKVFRADTFPMPYRYVMISEPVR